jgi:hypothetical protein
MRDPELVARAQRAAARLESAWEQWRTLHGLNAAPSQPIVSYVGYSLKEPWGEPRVVIGLDADEAEYLADFLDQDECEPRAQAALPQQIPVQQVVVTEPPAEGWPTGLQAPAEISAPISADLAGWTSGELPGQATEQLAGWPPGPPAVADQPPAVG